MEDHEFWAWFPGYAWHEKTILHFSGLCFVFCKMEKPISASWTVGSNSRPTGCQVPRKAKYFLFLPVSLCVNTRLMTIAIPQRAHRGHRTTLKVGPCSLPYLRLSPKFTPICPVNFQGVLCLRFSSYHRSPGIAYTLQSPALHGVWGFEPRPSHLHSKCFTHWVISPAPRKFYLNTKNDLKKKRKKPQTLKVQCKANSSGINL